MSVSLRDNSYGAAPYLGPIFGTISHHFNGKCMGNAWEMHGKYMGNAVQVCISAGTSSTWGGFPASMEMIRGAYKRILTRSHLLYLTIIRT